MSNSRFPLAKYRRTLHDMYDQLLDWRITYEEAAEETTSTHLEGRFAGRIAVINEALHQVARLRDTLEELPRLS